MADHGINIKVTSQGVDDLVQVFEKLPAKVALRPLRATLRKAAEPLKLEVQKNLPAKFRELEQAVTTKNMRSFAGVKTGIYTKRVVVELNGPKGTRVQFDAYYPLYWHNYGTLERRDPTHKFTKPVRHMVHRFPGIHAQRFIQKSYDSKFGEVVKYAEENLLKDAEAYVDRATNRFLKKQVV